MSERFLLDTDVVIEYLRGRQEAVDYIENLEGDLFLSAMTVAELCTGVRGQKEQNDLEQFLLAFEVIPVTLEVARRGGLFRRKYGPSHRTGLADALIAATAELNTALLITFNVRHYPMLFNRVKAPYARSQRR